MPNMNIPLPFSTSFVMSFLQHSLLRKGLSILLLVLVSWYSASLVWLLMMPEQQVVSQYVKTGSVTTPSLAVTLFGQAQTPDRAMAAAQALADASVLQGWVLLGVVIDNADRLALVQQGQNGTLSWLREGQRTAQGLDVIQIDARQVQLMTRQGVRTLTLSAQSISASPVSAQPLPTNDLKQLRSMIKQDPSKAMNVMRLAPQWSDGKLTGVAVSPGPGYEILFTSLGLQKGDVLVSLNGDSMQAWMSKMGALPSILDGQGAQAKVLRAGKEIDVALNW
jgi:type II secretion system protein C